VNQLGSCAIATPHAGATEAGAEAFRSGGSAVDAAVAAAAAVAVAYPHMNSIGGDVIALLRHPDARVEAINGIGGSAAACAVDALRASRGGMPVHGVHAITVPGAVAAWETLVARGARLPWPTLLEAAIAHARDGVVVTPGVATALAEDAPALAQDAGMAALFFPGGRPLAVGDRLRQPALARTLEAIARDGARALYAGDVGTTLVDGLRALGSPLTRADFAAHATECTTPLRADFGGHTIVTSPPPSQGHVLLELLGALAEIGDVPDLLRRDAALLTALFEATTADRDRHLADPRVVPVPLDRLLSRAHARRLLAAARERVAGGSGEPELTASPTGDTIAIVAADDEGCAVSLIQSIFHSFGARILEPRTGILLHNRGAFFSLDASSPNCLAPGKRPAHTLMPVLVERGRDLVGVHGTMGGKAQPQIHAQLLLQLRDGATPAAAIAAPRWVVGGLDVGDPRDLVLAERRADGDAAQALAAAGWPIRDLPAFDESVGHAQLIRRSPDGEIDAASDPRADGAATVVRR
jgi:gamma-glutamyltranspeptidase/glutathione hydrolase